MTNDINKAVDCLRQGGVILYPTDTIWGLGCDATNNAACEKLFSLKQRDLSKSMLILVNSTSMLERYVSNIPEIAFDIIDAAVSPVTIIYPEARNLVPGIIANDGSIGIRVTNHPFCSNLIEAFRKPIVSTSANFSGKPSPKCYHDIDSQLIESVDFVVEAEQNIQNSGISSEIIKFFGDGSFKILR